MKLNKKAVSPVVAVMLLVAVAVTSVSSYAIWARSYQAQIQDSVQDSGGLIDSIKHSLCISECEARFDSPGKEGCIAECYNEEYNSGNGAEEVENGEENEIEDIICENLALENNFSVNPNTNYVTTNGINSLRSDIEGYLQWNDDNPSDKWSLNVKIYYEFDQATIIKAYTVCCTDEGFDRRAKKTTVQGYDGEWALLSLEQQLNYSGNCATVSIQNEEAYKKYRLIITDSYHSTRLRVSSIKLWNCLPD